MYKVTRTRATEYLIYIPTLNNLLVLLKYACRVKKVAHQWLMRCESCLCHYTCVANQDLLLNKIKKVMIID